MTNRSQWLTNESSHTLRVSGIIRHLSVCSMSCSFARISLQVKAPPAYRIKLVTLECWISSTFMAMKSEVRPRSWREARAWNFLVKYRSTKKKAN